MKLVVNLIVHGSKIIQMKFYNFDKCWPIAPFLSITKINIPLKVPYLLALGHICESRWYGMWWHVVGHYDGIKCISYPTICHFINWTNILYYVEVIWSQNGMFCDWHVFTSIMYGVGYIGYRYLKLWQDYAAMLPLYNPGVV